MTTYSISLDDVDLALLPLRSHKYNDFLKKEHFQFQVMKTEEVEELEPTIYYKCHICALDVPAAFAHEHTTSLKHRANARIARVATQRTRKLISALPPPLVPQTARFCANCSTIVQKNHEQTKEHRVAVMHDKLLWELMTAYVGDDCTNEDSDTSDTDESVQEKASSRHYNGFATWKEVNNNEEEKQKKCEPKGLTSIEPNKKETNKKEDNEVEKQNNDNKPLDNKKEMIEVTNIDTRKPESSKSSEFTNIETETNKPIDTDKEPLFISVDKEPTQTTAKNEEIATSLPKPQDKIEYVEFVTKNNKIVKVFSDYYHSFTRKGETISCKVCSVVFNSEEVDSHMFSLKHLNKMPSTLINEHCVRKINVVFSHCILCNTMIKHTNLVKHYLTLGHSQREKQVITDNPNFHATTTNLDKVNTLKSHKLNLDVKIKTVDTSTTSKSPEVKVTEGKSIDWPVIYPYEMTKQGVRCVICDCLVPNNPENRKGHLDGLNHVTNVRNKKVFKLEYPFEATEDASIARCAVCDIKVSISQASLKEHIDGMNHAANKINKKVTKVIKLEFPYEATKDPNFARCAICDIKLTISQITLKDHLEGRNHATNEMNKKKRAANAFKPTNKASVARCVVCEINVPNTLRNLLDHLFGSNHVKKEQSKRDTQQNAASQTVPQPAKVAQPSTSGGKTFESTSDTIGVTPQNLYFSWI
ncbi:uncharacterized protein LOC134753111 isoform X2 [Cydia strobilella]|uniref:uncharacterized protein LOC134753111 isoform X2 n=1 Tax=Cydia strobilella TaxID=1100964 RepID=UPI003005E3C7